MFLGLDLGTSEVKALLLDGNGRIVGTAGSALALSSPQPLWSEQNPTDWWQATEAAVAQLRAAHPDEFAAVRGIGLSGQMHGAVLLDEVDTILRPAILWNDGRCHADSPSVATARSRSGPARSKVPARASVSTVAAV